jgi:divalent metal cation (Fe/Co/Zn/Cd) transporter
MGFAFYVDLHIHVNGHIPVNEGHIIAHAVEEAIMSAYATASTQWKTMRASFIK